MVVAAVGMILRCVCSDPAAVGLLESYRQLVLVHRCVVALRVGALLSPTSDRQHLDGATNARTVATARRYDTASEGPLRLIKLRTPPPVSRNHLSVRASRA